MKNTFIGYDDISVKAFYKISETNDLTWFFKDFDGFETIKLTSHNEIELSERFKQIFVDRIDYLDDFKTKEYYRKLIEVNIMKMKLYRVNNTFNTLKEIPFENEYFNIFVDDLKKDGFKYGKKVEQNEVEPYLKLMQSKIRGFKTKYSALKLEYKDVLELKEASKKLDLVREMIVLQEVLPEQKINEDMRLKMWDGMGKRAEEKVKAQKAQMDKIKSKR